MTPPFSRGERPDVIRDAEGRLVAESVPPEVIALLLSALRMVTTTADGDAIPPLRKGLK